MKTSDPAFEELLSRYFDGELEPDQALEVEACLREDAAAESMLEQLGQTRDLLRQNYRAELERMDFSDFWSGIEQGIAKQQADPDAAASPVRPLSPRRDPGIWERVRAWIDGLGWSGWGVGIAMAAAALFAIGLSRYTTPGDQVALNNPPRVAPEVKPAPAPVQAHPEEESVAVAQLPQEELQTDGIEVNSVSSGSASTVMVFKSPEQGTIIWVQEEDGEGGTSI